MSNSVRRIVVVEDDTSMGQAIERILRIGGFQPLHFASAEAALHSDVADIVFAAGLFEAAKGQLAGAAFVVDSKVEDHHKDMVRGICETNRRAEDFGK